MIEDLLQNQKQRRPRTAVAYYYFNFQTKAEQQSTNLLRSIILQLSCQCPNLPEPIERLQYQSESSFSYEYLINISKEVLRSFCYVYIVIDALDECEQGGEVLQWIKELLEMKNGKVHLLVSSRQDHHFRGALVSSTASILALDEHNFEKDIQLYIRNQLSTDPRMMRWPPSVQNNVEQSLIRNAGGLLVAFETL